MSTTEGGINIVLDKLIYYLDATNNKSYVSGSTLWDDISKENKNSGTLVNGVSFSETNKGSLLLDGVNNYISLPQITTNQTEGNYSVSFWFSFTNTITPANGTNFMLMEAQNTLLGGFDNYIYLLGSTSGRIGYQTFNNFSVVYTTTDTWVGGRWYNFTATYDIITSSLKIYVNGVLEGSTIIANGYFNTNTYFNLGTYSDPSKTWFFNGRLSNFMVYTKTLSQQEISQNYNTLKSRLGLS